MGQVRHGSHHDVAGELARWAHVPVEEAKEIYEEELAKLAGQATVTTYLPVIAKRRARERLGRNKGHH